MGVRQTFDEFHGAPLRVNAALETWPLAVPFVISRERFAEVSTVAVTIEAGDHRGRGECCPVPNHGETPEGVLDGVQALLEALRSGESWQDLHDSTPPGASRNAVDCAIWDLRAKRAGRRVWELLGLSRPAAVQSVFTIGLDSPGAMARRAVETGAYPILKLKLGPGDNRDRIAAVRAAVPGKRLIADANEAWGIETFEANLPALEDAGVEMIEQPLPAGSDASLAGLEAKLLIGADESCHVTADLERIAGRYGLVNIKLDKTGGLTEAVRLIRAARGMGLETMVGCMLGTSLAMAPALLLASGCRFVDLDGPLLMGRDRSPGLSYRAGRVQPPSPDLWG